MRCQPLADLVQRQPLRSVPGEDLLYHAGRLQHDVVTSRLTEQGGHVAVAIRRTSQHADRATLRGVSAAPPAAFQDLGALVFGDDALDLEQELVRGGLLQRAVEEDDFDPVAVELFKEQHLVGVFACQTIRGVDIEAVELASGSSVAQAFQGRPPQGGAAVAVVGEAAGRVELQAIVADAFVQGIDLAGDGLPLGLLLGGDAGIKGD